MASRAYGRRTDGARAKAALKRAAGGTEGLQAVRRKTITHQHEGAERIVDHGLVVERQHPPAGDERERAQAPEPPASCEAAQKKDGEDPPTQPQTI